MGPINAFFDSVEVFKKLGIDSTVIFQFIIFIVTFLILNALFFSKLLFVLQQREGKTTKLDGQADDKFAEAEKMSAKYKLELQDSNIKGQEIFSKNKNETIDRERARFKKTEAEVNDEVNNKRKEIEAEFLVKKESLLKNADSLANDLSAKLTT